jgi:hypothetical protein
MKKLIYKTVDEAIEGLGCEPDAYIDAYGVQEQLTDWSNESNTWAMDMLAFIRNGGLRAELEAQLSQKGTLDVTPDHPDVNAKTRVGAECDIRLAAVDKLLSAYRKRTKAKE